MKRTLTAAAALLICATSANAYAQGKKDKDREAPAAARPAPAPKPPRVDRPATPAPARPAPVAPVARPAPSYTPPPPRPDRPDRPAAVQQPNPVQRPDRAPRPDRPRPDRTPDLATPVRPDVAKTPRPDRIDRPAAARPDRTPRPDRPVKRPDRPRPVVSAPNRPRPPHAALPTRPNRAARPARPVSPQAVARSRQLRQALRSQRIRTYSYRGRTLRAVKARPYVYPHGWRYRAWRKHQRFPRELFLASFFLNNFLSYGLSAPPPGYYWVRFGPDAVLVNANSYDVYDTAYGVFDDGSGYNTNYDDNADLPPIDEDMPREFMTGELDVAAGIDQSDACGFFYGDRQTQDDIDRAWADQDWNGLAKTVIWAGCGNDISYYLLGLAAEGLALPDAAGAYYGRAVELADGDVDSTFKCAVTGSDSCRGMDIGREASDGLDRIYGPAN